MNLKPLSKNAPQCPESRKATAHNSSWCVVWSLLSLTSQIDWQSALSTLNWSLQSPLFFFPNLHSSTCLCQFPAAQNHHHTITLWWHGKGYEMYKIFFIDLLPPVSPIYDLWSLTHLLLSRTWCFSRRRYLNERLCRIFQTI